MNNELNQFGLYLSNNPNTVNLFKKRAIFLKKIREFLDREGHIELEMPCLQIYREGAPIHQFVTVNPITNQRYYLRHCFEDHLKRIVNSFPKVYELGKAFRVEVEDEYRLQEFTVLELVEKDTHFMNGVKLITKLIQHIIYNTFGTLNINGLDFNKIKLIKFDDLMTDCIGYDSKDPNFRSKSLHKLKEKGIDLKKDSLDWEIYEELLKSYLEPSLEQPVIIVDFPVALQHVSKINEENGFAERCSIMVKGIEVGDGGVKVNTSDKYKKIYKNNADYREKILGIKDNDMPTEYFIDIDSHSSEIFTAGIGVDRLFAICNNLSIQQVVLFPFH